MSTPEQRDEADALRRQAERDAHLHGPITRAELLAAVDAALSRYAGSPHYDVATDVLRAFRDALE